MILFIEVFLDALDEVTRIPFTLAGDDHNVFRIYHNSLHTVSILVLGLIYTNLLPHRGITIGQFDTKRQIVYEAEVNFCFPAIN